MLVTSLLYKGTVPLAIRFSVGSEHSFLSTKIPSQPISWMTSHPSLRGAIYTCRGSHLPDDSWAKTVTRTTSSIATISKKYSHSVPSCMNSLYTYSAMLHCRYYMGKLKDIFRFLVYIHTSSSIHRLIMHWWLCSTHSLEESTVMIGNATVKCRVQQQWYNENSNGMSWCTALGSIMQPLVASDNTTLKIFLLLLFFYHLHHSTTAVLAANRIISMKSQTEQHAAHKLVSQCSEPNMECLPLTI